MDKKEMKARKKAYKKARSKAIRPWKWLTWLSVPIAIILTVVTVVVTMFDNTIALFAGGIIFGILGVFISFPLAIIIVTTYKH